MCICVSPMCEQKKVPDPSGIGVTDNYVLSSLDGGKRDDTTPEKSMSLEIYIFFSFIYWPMGILIQI